MSKRPNILIAVPAQDHCATWFAYDWARLAAYSVARGLGVTMAVLKTAYLPSSRIQLAEMGLASKADHILWLDSDMRFPKDALVRLLAHREPIVAASYSMRRMPLAPVASTSFDQSSPVYVPDTASGLTEVAMVGMGCMLTATSVFDTMTRPWFATPYREEHRDVMGEDVWFCQRAKEAGYRIMVDQGLTQKVGHLGEWEFGNAQLNAFKAEQDNMTPQMAVVA